MSEFTNWAKVRGWKMKEVAKRWGVTPRRMSQIAADPKQKDWDALNGLPDFWDGTSCQACGVKYTDPAYYGFPTCPDCAA